jgi:hypothetical protein
VSECTAYSRGLYVKGEEEEAVSFCAASDKSRGRGRGRFEARRVRVLLLWLERLSERGKRSEWTVDSLARESVVAWAEGADAGWEFWMAAARAGSLISRPGWDRRRAIGNALAGGAAVVVGVSGGGGEGGRGGEHYSARRTWIGTVCSALRGVCLSVDLQAKTSDGPTGLEVSGKHCCC